MPQYSPTERLAIAGSLVAAGLVGVFILGMRYAASPNPAGPAAPSGDTAATAPATAPSGALASTPVGRDAQRHLDAAESLVAQAIVVFEAANDTPGGPAEKALAQAKLISQDLIEGQAYIQAHPDLTAQPNLRATGTFSGGITQQTVALRNGLDDLSSALAEIQKVPHALGGARDKSVNDIMQMANVVRITTIQPNPRAGLTPEAINALLTPTPTPDRYKPLRFASAPADGPALALTIRSLRAAAVPELATVTAADLSPPLRTFTVTARDNNDHALENAVDSGYTYLVDASKKTVAREIVRFDRTTGRTTLYSRTLLGTPVPATYKFLADVEPALAQLAGMDQVKAGSYEPRLLSVGPPASIEAIWLVSDKGAPDLIFILASAIPAEPVQKLIPADQFIKLLRLPPPTPPTPAPTPTPVTPPARGG